MSNRIDPLSSTATQGRQTPRNEFGKVLADTASGVLQTGMNVIGGVVHGSPVLSAAVSGVQKVLSTATTGSGASSGEASLASAKGGSETAPAGGGSEWDLLEAQRAMQSESAAFNMNYLALQESLQKESRQFNAVSNILKVRHDTAKSTINNVR